MEYTDGVNLGEIADQVVPHVVDGYGSVDSMDFILDDLDLVIDELSVIADDLDFVNVLKGVRNDLSDLSVDSVRSLKRRIVKLRRRFDRFVYNKKVVAILCGNRSDLDPLAEANRIGCDPASHVIFQMEEDERIDRLQEQLVGYLCDKGFVDHNKLTDINKVPFNGVFNYFDIYECIFKICSYVRAIDSLQAASELFVERVDFHKRVKGVDSSEDPVIDLGDVREWLDGLIESYESDGDEKLFTIFDRSGVIQKLVSTLNVVKGKTTPHVMRALIVRAISDIESALQKFTLKGDGRVALVVREDSKLPSALIERLVGVVGELKMNGLVDDRQINRLSGREDVKFRISSLLLAFKRKLDAADIELGLFTALIESPGVGMGQLSVPDVEDHRVLVDEILPLFLADVLDLIEFYLKVRSEFKEVLELLNDVKLAPRVKQQPFVKQKSPKQELRLSGQQIVIKTGGPIEVAEVEPSWLDGERVAVFSPDRGVSTKSLFSALSSRGAEVTRVSELEGIEPGDFDALVALKNPFGSVRGIREVVDHSVALVFVDPKEKGFDVAGRLDGVMAGIRNPKNVIHNG